MTYGARCDLICTVFWQDAMRTKLQINIDDVTLPRLQRHCTARI